VEVGQWVSEEDTVCIIEVMKLFSTIKAGYGAGLSGYAPKTRNGGVQSSPLLVDAAAEEAHPKGRKSHEGHIAVLIANRGEIAVRIIRPAVRWGSKACGGLRGGSG